MVLSNRVYVAVLILNFVGAWFIKLQTYVIIQHYVPYPTVTNIKNKKKKE